MKPSELLRKNGWTQNAMARDKDGKKVDFFDSKATQFCLIGAVAKCYYQKDFNKYLTVFRDLFVKLGNVYPSSWNDSSYRNKDQVIKLLESINE